jgi:hypothetical protein
VPEVKTMNFKVLSLSGRLLNISNFIERHSVVLARLSFLRASLIGS